MKIKAFRIQAFRSIKKTAWLPFSIDGITALVGQNESGKTAVLDALALGFSGKPNIQRNDFRSDSGYPEVALEIVLNEEDLDSIFENFSNKESLEIKSLISSQKSIEFICRIEDGASGDPVRRKMLSNDLTKKIAAIKEGTAKIKSTIELIGAIATAANGGGGGQAARANDQAQVKTDSVEADRAIGLDDLINGIWWKIPAFVLFNESLCYLPDSIEIKNDQLESGPGSRGAANFFSAAGIGVPQVLGADDRALATLVKRSSTKVTKELQNFWSQVLGKKGKINIDFELRHHAASKGDKSGMPYILFWISEGDGERLHPSQRSKGTRWFVSFFLQMLAAQNESDNLAFLLDEPGAFLHARAQQDVLRLLERLDTLRPIIYSTHSPYLIDQQKIYRILAIERVDDEEGSETVVRRGLELAASSPVTLAPILATMGLNFSDQSVIKKSGNILLEESSAHYYYLAFCGLLNVGEELSFVACGGVDSIRMVVDLMTAWGIDYMLLVDDDKQGKTVCRDIKGKYGLSDDEARKKLRLTDGFSSVEDVFSPDVFKDVVAKGFDLDWTRSNSEAVKLGGVSKPMLAVNFFDGARRGEINLDMLDQVTVERFKSFINAAEAYFKGQG